jgi:hypothetical protein
MTFVSKQCTWHSCSNNTNRWMTSMLIPFKPMKRKFHNYYCQIVTHEICDEGKFHFSYLDFVRSFAIAFPTMIVVERF